ncbi:hypothetical protein CFP65_7511 [Kitasatospora sp. MMS16-BH015]|uniref:DUF2797 domain-containing protein n=1 Tax=Kitasatospora sp. MMS16-BH015 TaxID=2018025 RepID=UPI000CA17455|nr:DUF2797 domain-containing protein [Kitasatospora sp. MMS16-BH015]AUG82088.1 hypothetical protein CFP65_7511 [Kitasatospora sp. MMS16-BH015]
MAEEETAGWTATGLRWLEGRPVLTAARGELVHQRVVAPGTEIGWRLAGPRRCTGARTATGHRPCPHRAELAPAARSVQCEPCQGVDIGLALARGQNIHDNGKTYRLYLAWFGAGLLKVGLTAEERGTSRLEEQAALTYGFVARGPLPAIRRAELTVAQAGLARERLTGRVKHERWWGLPAAAERRAQLAELRAAVLRVLDGHGLELLPEAPLVDQCGLYGLAEGAPPVYREVTALAEGALLAGRLRAPVGRYLFLDTEEPTAGAPPLLLDTRLLTGWRLVPARRTPAQAGSEPPDSGPLGSGHIAHGVTLRTHRRPEPTGEQTALF